MIKSQFKKLLLYISSLVLNSLTLLDEWSKTVRGTCVFFTSSSKF